MADLFDSEFLESLARSRRRSLPILQSAPKSCQGCGACCDHYDRIPVDLSDPNYEWLRSRGMIYQLDDKAFMKKANARRCAALTGEVGKEVNCSIYENRPEVCRTFPEGEAACRTVIILELSRNIGCQLWP